MHLVTIERFSLAVTACLVLLLAGCGHLHHPKAKEYLEQAQGSDRVETLLNLTDMMQATLRQARGDTAYQPVLDVLHDQFHALHMALCCVSDPQARHPSYVKAETIEQEMRTVFHRLWKYRDDETLRDLHLGLFESRLQELQESLRALHEPRTASLKSAVRPPL